jgi:integrase
MGRTALPPGTAGEITVFPVVQNGKTRHRATVRLRELDGSLKEVNRIRDTQGLAKRAVREAIADRLRDVSSSTLTVSSLVQEFLDGIGDTTLAPKTQQDYRYAAKRIFDDPLAKAAPSAVTVGRVKSFLEGITASYGSGSARHVRAVLRHSLELAVEREEIPVNPVSLFRSRAKKRQVRETHEDSKKSLTDGELATLLWRLYHDDEALPMQGSRKSGVNGKDVADLVNFLFATGCRVGEALAVRWGDLNLDDGIVDISGSVAFLTGQGSVRQERTKTKRSTRYVPLARRTVAMLRRRSRRLGTTLNEAPVFGSPQKPYAKRDASNLNKVIRRLFNKYGVDWGRSHLGRRYRITSLAERGVPFHKIADMVGHGNVATTMQYLGRSRAVDAQVRDAL